MMKTRRAQRMKTRKAQSIRRRSLLKARIYGHKPALISHEGALALYGCYQCERTMEIWDNPNCVNGTMPERPCSEELSWWRKVLIKLI